MDYSTFRSNIPYYKQEGCQDGNGTGDLPLLELTLIFSTAVFILEYYIDLRQLGNFIKGGKVAQELTEHVSDETFHKSIAYGKDKFQFKVVESLVMFIEGTVLVFLGYAPFAWDLSKFCSAEYLGVYTGNGYSATFVEIVITWFFVIFLTLFDTMVNLPFSLYQTFVVEQKHGFNKSTVALYVQDKLLTLALTCGLSIPVLSAVVPLVRSGGPYFYFYVWIFLFFISIFLMTVYPTVIAPLFNKYTKLEDGEIKTAIEDLSRQVSFPLTQIFSVDGSKRSAHSNAYFYGFFKSKRIVLYDTLLKQVTKSELLAILGHEIGHWKLWHTIQGFVISQLYIFCLFLAFSVVQHTPALFYAFGFAYTGDTTPVFVGLMLFTQTFWSPVEKVLSLLMTVNSRRNEFAADRFATELGMGEALSSGLIKISIENLDNMVPDKWYSTYHYSHPPLVERLRAIKKWKRD